MANRLMLSVVSDAPASVPIIQESGLFFEEDIYFPDHNHETHELLWNEHGASSAKVGSRVWTIAGSVGLWIPAGVIHSGVTPKGTLLRTAHFQNNAATSIANDPVTVSITPLLRLLLDRLANSDGQLSDHSRDVTEAMIIDVIEPDPHGLVVHIPTADVIEPIVEALVANPGDARTLEQWAKQLGVSSRTITRVFRTESGLGFAEWTANIKAQRALELLGRGVPQWEIADQLGYASVSAFGVAFRRVTGQSPGTFAR